MKLATAKANAEGVPAELAGRVKIDKCEFGGVFEMDMAPILKLVPKTGKDSEGKTVVLKSATTGVPYYKRTVFVPFTANGQKYYTVSNSPLLFALFRDFPVASDSVTEKGVKWVFLDDTIEGKLRFAKDYYDYGSKGKQLVATIEEAEE